MLSCAEVAVFIDETSYSKIEDNEIGRRVVYNIRKPLGLMGVPYDVFLSSDFEEVKNNYKAYISLVPTETKLSSIIKDYARDVGIAYLEINKMNCDILPNDLRKFAKNAGAFIYSNKNAVVYANTSFVFLHIAEDGVQDFNIPGATDYKEIFENKYYSREFHGKVGESYLFKR